MTQERTVLVGYSVLHAPRELNPLLRELRTAGWNVIVLLGWTGSAADKAKSGLESEGFEVIRPPGSHAYEAESSEQPPPSSSKARSRLAARAPKWLKLLVHTFDYFRYVRVSQRHAREILAQVRPALFLTHNFHSCGRLDNALLAEAKGKGIPSACVLVSPLVGRFIVRPGRLTQYKAGMTGEAIRVSFYGWAGQLAARLKPDWVVADASDAIFAWPLSMLLGTKLAGLLPRDVWHSPHEDFDVVFGPNAFSQDILLKSGYPSDRVHILGAPRLDEALEFVLDPGRETQLYREIGLPQGSPYLLWNLEPSWEHSYCSEERHWEWVRRICSTLKASRVPVVVSLHPLCNPENYEFLSAEFGFTIPRQLGIHQLYPGASLVLTFPCSTNQYATLFGKRVVMYDWFEVFESPRRRQLYELENMRLATTFEELESAVAAEARDLQPPNLSSYRSGAIRKASTAITAVIDDLLSRKTARAG